jgi:aspartate racemase
MSRSPLLGVLGGMGPLATVDFLHKLIEECPGSRDQDHVPVLTWSVPQIPDRQRALAGTGESPLPALQAGVRMLEAAGVTRIAMPCSTAHHWFDELQALTTLPFFHIADASVDRLGARHRPVGILATRGTTHTGLYQRRLAARGIEPLLSTQDEIDILFTPGCYAVKRGELEQGGRLLEAAARRLLDRGATQLLLACTEVPIALASIGSPLLAISVDTNRALARACVDYWLGVRTASDGVEPSGKAGARG